LVVSAFAEDTGVYAVRTDFGEKVVMRGNLIERVIPAQKNL